MTPSIGRIVHYVAGDLPWHRAAIITEVHEQGAAAAINAVSLAVFDPTGLVFAAHVPYEASGLRVGTWHWPERVE